MVSRILLEHDILAAERFKLQLQPFNRCLLRRLLTNNGRHILNGAMMRHWLRFGLQEQWVRDAC